MARENNQTRFFLEDRFYELHKKELADMMKKQAEENMKVCFRDGYSGIVPTMNGYSEGYTSPVGGGLEASALTVPSYGAAVPNQGQQFAGGYGNGYAADYVQPAVAAENGQSSWAVSDVVAGNSSLNGGKRLEQSELYEMQPSDVLNYMLATEGPLTAKELADRTRNSHMISNFGQPINIVNDFIKYRFNPEYRGLSDKYRHALINCRAAQRGIKDAIRVNNFSRLKEFYDVTSGNNTLDASNEDGAANNIRRYLGIKYPQGDCDELVQRYIKKTY